MGITCQPVVIVGVAIMVVFCFVFVSLSSTRYKLSRTKSSLEALTQAVRNQTAINPDAVSKAAYLDYVVRKLDDIGSEC
jgi:uncharacterized protein YoxC